MNPRDALAAKSAALRLDASPSLADRPRDDASLTGERNASSRFRLYTDAELDALPDPVPLIEDYATQNSLVALVGPYASFKSFVLLDQALCIGVGADWQGRRVTQGPVVYIYAEGRHGIRKRVAAWKAAYGYTGGTNVSFLPSSVLLNEPGQVAGLLAAIAQLPAPPVAVFVDTVARNMTGNENDVDAMGRFVRGCDAIREATGATVFLAHHTGWSADRSRGSTALPGATDTEVIIERDDRLLTLKCNKQKDSAEFAPISLEAYPIAESLALRPVVPNRAELTRNERRALTEVQAADGLTSTQWRAATELGKGSFANARNRLVTLVYVKQSKKLYMATEAGRQALGTKSSAGTTEVQPSGAQEVQRVPLSKSGDAVPPPCTSLEEAA